MQNHSLLNRIDILPINLYFQCFVETSWNDYYNGVQEKTTNLTEHFTVLDNIWIYSSIFQNIESYHSNGAALCKNSGTSYNFLVEFSIFHECNTISSDGGAIYFSTGQCVISSSCGYKCTAGDDGDGQFCYVQASENSKNYVIDSSITKISTEKGDYTLKHEKGNVLCKGVNISNNEVDYLSGICINNPTTSSISFSSFRNNKGSSQCIRCYLCSNTQITTTNIIDNEQNTTSSNYGIIHSYSATISMIHCSIFGNKPGNGFVFYGSITCTFCSMTENQKTPTYGSVTINNEPLQSFINYYLFLELGECQAGLESWSDITPNIPFLGAKSFTFYCRDFLIRSTPQLFVFLMIK